MRVFVTGGTGFVGCRVVSRLLALKHQVTLLTRRLRTASLASLVGCRPVVGDLCVPSTFSREIEGCDAVIHAARDDSADSCARALRDMQGSLQLLQYSALCGVRRFVYLSSIAAYEHTSSGSVDERSPRTESSEPYAFSKVWIERALLASGMRLPEVVILQPGNIYGPGDGWWGFGQLQMMHRGNVIVPAFGEGTANLVFVDDLVSFTVASIETPGIGGESFLVTDGGAATWKEYYSGLEEIVGRPSALYVSEKEALELSRSLMVRSIGARVMRYVSRRALGKRIVFPLSEGAIKQFASTAVFRNSKACARFGITPTVSLGAGLESMKMSVAQKATWRNA